MRLYWGTLVRPSRGRDWFLGGWYLAIVLEVLLCELLDLALAVVPRLELCDVQGLLDGFLPGALPSRAGWGFLRIPARVN
jgi:hypothetical protein